MVSRRVTRSFKVAALKSDTARLFFTWLIPYLDVEGRMEASPGLIKADLFPLLGHITFRVINRLLRELSDAGLIILYECNGKLYLQLCQFIEHQRNLRKDREAPSKYPPPPDIYSGPTPDLLRSESGPTPAQAKLREEKIREAKGPDTKQPVDNSAVIEEEPPPFDLPNPKPENPKKEPSEEKAKPKKKIKKERTDQPIHRGTHKQAVYFQLPSTLHVL